VNNNINSKLIVKIIKSLPLYKKLNKKKKKINDLKIELFLIIE